MAKSLKGVSAADVGRRKQKKIKQSQRAFSAGKKALARRLGRRAATLNEAQKRKKERKASSLQKQFEKDVSDARSSGIRRAQPISSDVAKARTSKEQQRPREIFKEEVKRLITVPKAKEALRKKQKALKARALLAKRRRS